jgi:site-specific DNA recombinase
MRAIIYRRVSSDEQVESGAGLGAQLDACIEFAGRKGWEVAGDFQEKDGLSGKTPLPKCPGLSDALAALKVGDVLLVSRRDRIARDVMKVGMIEALLKTKKCQLVSAAGEGTEELDPDNPMGFLMRKMSDMLAEFELLLIRFRTRAGMQRRRRQGDRMGRVPFGTDLHDDGRRSKAGMKRGEERPVALRPNPREVRVLELMRALRGDGWTYRQIARYLNLFNYSTKAGKPWSHSSVHWVLTSPNPLTLTVHDGQTTHAQAEGPGQPAA